MDTPRPYATKTVDVYMGKKLEVRDGVDANALAMWRRRLRPAQLNYGLRLGFAGTVS